MTTPVSNIPTALNRVNTPRSDTAPIGWNTPEFHMDTAMVAQKLRDGVGMAGREGFLAFLAGPSGNRVLTYSPECHEGVKQMVCGYWGCGLSGLSGAERGHINRICANQGWVT
jgi:hypothetical protein